MSGTDKGRPLEKNPVVSQEIVAWLDMYFPVVSPGLDESEREIFHRVGQRSVVDHLIALFREQNHNLLE